MRFSLARPVLVSVLAGVLLSGSALAAPVHYDIDGGHSMAVFKIRHMGVANFYGRFNDVSGHYVVDQANPAASKVSVVIKADSVDTNSEKRDKHVKSPDFFDAIQFPTITFESSSAKAIGGGDLELRGKLSLHGVTRDLIIPVRFIGEGNDPWGGYRSGYEGTFTIKRSDYGMNELQGPLGDEVTVIISLEGVKKK
ncbi:MAG: YceI family protein [Acidobacteriota bacterium]